MLLSRMVLGILLVHNDDWIPLLVRLDLRDRKLRWKFNQSMNMVGFSIEYLNLKIHFFTYFIKVFFNDLLIDDLSSKR